MKLLGPAALIYELIRLVTSFGSINKKGCHNLVKAVLRFS